MTQILNLERRREQILQEMREIRAMRKGSVTQQHLKVRLKGQDKPVLRGPYWLYTRKERGKTVGRRVSSEAAERLQEEVAAWHRFQELCQEYAQLTQQLGELERGLGEGSQEKKLRRSRSRKTRK